MKSPQDVLDLVKSVPDALRIVKGWNERVTVQLRGGSSYSAVVGEVGAHMVLLKAPAGNDFVDVVVRVDEIVAIEVQVRG